MTISADRAIGYRPLRDLTDEEFEAIYGCDRFTTSVLASRFRYVVDNMCSQVMNRAFSPIIRDVTDMSGALTGPPSEGYPMPAVAQTIPLFFGSLPEGVQRALEEYGLERLVPGDVIMANDPYRVGTHVNDVCLIRPVIVDGELITALTIRAHMLDWGGKIMGGFTHDKGSLFEDGLVLAPQLLFHAGDLVEPLVKIIRDNTRFAAMVMPDIMTINACLEGAESLVVETFERYGRAAYFGAMKYAIDASAESMRIALEALPDGVYSASAELDSNGTGGSETACTVHVEISKRGPNIEFDFSGTSPVNASSLNSAWTESKTAATFALKWLIDPHGPYTSGSSRYIDVVLPPDTFINPSPPTSTCFYHLPTHAMITAIMRALNPVLGDKAVALDSGDAVTHVAFGVNPGGQPWYAHPGAVLPALPWGATRDGDGDGSQVNPYINAFWAGDEPTEATHPLVILGRDYVADSGGAGHFRGGATMAIDSLWLEPSQHVAYVFMSKRTEGGGVEGGRPGGAAASWVFQPEQIERFGDSGFLPHRLPATAYREAEPLFGTLDPDTNEPDVDGVYRITLTPVSAPAGSLVRYRFNGGGGFRDPFTRPLAAVLADVRNEYVTIEGAARDYGVVVVGDPANDPEGLSIDEAATANLRNGH